MIPDLSRRYRVIAPDLPGFGASSHDVPDYSFRAHARYVLELMDALGIHDAHVVGFSMGGGVVLSMADIAPRRVDSITMLSAIGVQEMELLGDYTLNHALHALQLAGLWGLRELTPQFGFLDDAMLGVPYARNFFDSDQRPLRGILSRYPGPMLIIHGRNDPLVPIAAAREHARLVPQAELVVTPNSHFMVFRDGPWVAATIGAFLDAVEAGTARTRADADPAPNRGLEGAVRPARPPAHHRIPLGRRDVPPRRRDLPQRGPRLHHRRPARDRPPPRLRAGDVGLLRRDRRGGRLAVRRRAPARPAGAAARAAASG